MNHKLQRNQIYLGTNVQESLTCTLLPRKCKALLLGANKSHQKWAACHMDYKSFIKMESVNYTKAYIWMKGIIPTRPKITKRTPLKTLNSGLSNFDHNDDKNTAEQVAH